MQRLTPRLRASRAPITVAPMDGSSDPASSTPTHRWKDWLGLNTSTLALLGTILLVTAATELWAPLIPQSVKALRPRAGSGGAGMTLLVGLYGFYRDALEAITSHAGGAPPGGFNTRRSLLFFN